MLYLLLGLLLSDPPPGSLKMEPQTGNPNPSISREQIERFNQALQQLLLSGLPDPLYEKRTGEDRVSRAPNGLKWQGLRPVVQHGDKKDGPRRHIVLTAPNARELLKVKVRNLELHPHGRTTFEVHLFLPARLEFTEALWKKGLRLYDSTVRARVQLFITLYCESTMRYESGGWLPTIVYRLRVKKMDLLYTDLVVEHIAGLGGEAAKFLGKAAIDTLRQWRPSIERRLQERLEAQITKAADTKEIRLGLDGLSRRQPDPPKRRQSDQSP